MKYVTRVTERKPIRAGVWSTLLVEVLRGPDGSVVGSYERNYPSLFDTFCPFAKAGRESALYSPDYTGTRVMELPSCRDLGGEERSSEGFCPVDYFVPVDADTNEAGDVGLVAGCIWGDDTSWKIQALDLSGVESGKVARDDRFGYVELPEGLRLSEAVTVNRCDPHAECEGLWIEVRAALRFELATGRQLKSYDI
jgi:hypothetical protein